MKIDPATYCIGCRKFLNHQCDILGPGDIEKQQLCARAGYRETKYTNSSVRIYANRRGDMYDTEQGR